MIVYLFFAIALAWIEDAQLRTEAENRVPRNVSEYTLNLDLAPVDRWTELGTKFKSEASELVDYFQSMLPSWAIPVLEEMGKGLKKVFPDWIAEEMEGIATATGLDPGLVVVMNMVYQFESIGQNCSMSNTTGPGCKDSDDGPPGFCTSTTFNGDDGNMYLARNLDWNLPQELLNMVVNLDYQRGGKTVYKGTTIVGFVGVINGVRPGTFAGSMNARNSGGNILVNLIDAILEGDSITPAQTLRIALENSTSYDEAVAYLKSQKLINDVYFIVSGVEKDDGVVLSRARNSNADAWPLNSTEENGWYRLQTNYDHWEDVPASDNRRDPGNKYMQEMGQTNANLYNVWEDVMTQWPVYNPHTDFTALVCPNTGYLTAAVWVDSSTSS